MRSRKPVNYSFNDLEVEDDVDSFDQSNPPRLCEELVEEKSSDIHDACGDVATDFSRGKESRIKEITLKENLPAEDYLESEGRFCTDAGATSHPRIGNGDDNSVDSDPYGGDYLKMGGGFCLDDSETGGNNRDAIDDDMNTATTVDYSADFAPSSDFLGETDRDKSSSDMLFSGAENDRSEIQQDGVKPNANSSENANSYDRSDIGVLIPENAHHNSGTSAGAFSAMPFLRKRKKN